MGNALVCKLQLAGMGMTLQVGGEGLLPGGIPAGPALKEIFESCRCCIVPPIVAVLDRSSSIFAWVN